MTAIPASWWQPYTLHVYHRDMPGGVTCVCGHAAGELIRQSVATGLPGLTLALDEAEAAVDDDSDCAGWYEAAGPSEFTRSYP
jgi:hypothetical protein